MSPSRASFTRRGLIAAAVSWPLATRAAYQVREWPAGQGVPPLSLSDLDGKAWSLSVLRGRAVMLNFWATWCEPCRAEMPSLQAMARRHEADGLSVLMINYQEAEPTIRRFLEKMPIALPVLLDRDGAVARTWTSRVFPSTVMIDRSGRPHRVVVGEVDWTGEAARPWLADVLKPAGA